MVSSGTSSKAIKIWMYIVAIINTTYEIEYPLSCALFLHGVAKNNAHFHPFF